MTDRADKIADETVELFALEMADLFKEFLAGIHENNKEGLTISSVKLWQLCTTMSGFFKDMTTQALNGCDEETRQRAQRAATRTADLIHGALKRIGEKRREPTGPAPAETAGTPPKSDGTLN